MRHAQSGEEVRQALENGQVQVQDLALLHASGANWAPKEQERQGDQEKVEEKAKAVEMELEQDWERQALGEEDDRCCRHQQKAEAEAEAQGHQRQEQKVHSADAEGRVGGGL